MELFSYCFHKDQRSEINCRVLLIRCDIVS
jgi:hypothetical protein